MIAPCVAFVYFVMIGGTPWGELIGWLRVANSVLAGAFIFLYLVRAPQRSDRLDRRVILALVLFSAASVLSAFPRQSLDALLGVLAFAAILYVARDVTANAAAARMLMVTLRVLCLVIAGFLGLQQLELVADWWSLTGGTVLPPLSLPLVARPWGHAYDLLLLGLLLYPSWLIGPVARTRQAGAIVVGAVLLIVALLLGSRAIWLAIAVASVLVAAPHVVRLVVRRLKTGRGLAGALGVALLVLIAITTLGGPIIDRLVTSATVGQRVEMWAAGVDAWLARPVAGHGPGAFPWILQTTEYFDRNSVHPRHPDSALFQLLPEAGILGVIAALILVVAIVSPLIRTRKLLPLWPLTVLLVASVGMNPTEFSFLVVVVIVWAAFGIPRDQRVSRPDQSRVNLKPVLVAGFVSIAIATSAMLVAGIHYDSADFRQRDGDLAGARRDLSTAIALDPGMALYHRQYGVASILLHDPATAVDHLIRATQLNPSDTVGWRSLAIALAEQGKDQDALGALAQAISVQRSDLTNLLLLAAWQSRDGDMDSLKATVAEIALGWPTVMAAPGWQAIIGDELSGADIIASAIDRWQSGQPSPEPLRGQPLLLALLGERPDLFEEALISSGHSKELVDASVAVYWCQTGAEALLASVPAEDRRSGTYWGLRVQHAAELNQTDAQALELYRLITGARPSAEGSDRHMNPLQQNIKQGAVDAWGYDRVPIGWGDASIELPLPEAGAASLLLEPSVARGAMMLIEGPGSCQ